MGGGRDGGERRMVLVAGRLAAVWAVGAFGLPVAVGLVFLAGTRAGPGRSPSSRSWCSPGSWRCCG